MVIPSIIQKFLKTSSAILGAFFLWLIVCEISKEFSPLLWRMREDPVVWVIRDYLIFVYFNALILLLLVVRLMDTKPWFRMCFSTVFFAVFRYVYYFAWILVMQLYSWKFFMGKEIAFQTVLLASMFSLFSLFLGTAFDKNLQNVWDNMRNRNKRAG